MTKGRIFSGMQPSGKFHLGNYTFIGACSRRMLATGLYVGNGQTSSMNCQQNGIFARKNPPPSPPPTAKHQAPSNLQQSVLTIHVANTAYKCLPVLEIL